ncbi:MAG: amidohydrolase family protein [Proteobacteria bacterium]|nr:amidohydrolase family protein [Pseudomonadota bacterium]
MRKIDFEAHFVTKEYVRTMEENQGYPRYRVNEKTGKRRLWYTPEVGEPIGDPLLNKLLDVDEKRLENMDKAGIDVQVLSLTSPGVEQFDPVLGMNLARKSNDALAETIARHPDRFRGFAALAPKDAKASCKELERAVRELGFKGWKTHSNYGDSYLDDEQYWPILEKAAELGVPVYLHPAVPAIPALQKYGFVLAGAPFGFGIETAICMMRLIYSGVFDRFPDLTIMMGHLGEGLPFLLQRIDFAYVRPYVDADARPDLKKKPSDYLKEKVFVTTSGNYLQAAFMCTYEAMGVNRILLATDYPYEDSDECMAFLEGLPLSQEDKERIYFGNASRIGLSV